MNNKVLYISYNGLLEPILPSQTLPYLRILSKEGFRFILLTFEKNKDLKKCGQEGLKNIKDGLEKEGILWRRLPYHKYPDKISTFLDIAIGFCASLYLIFRHDIKIVHVRGATPGAIGLFLLNIFRFKLIFDSRGLLAEEYVGGRLWNENGLYFKVVKLAEEKLIKTADAIVVLTEKHYRKNLELPYLKERNIPMVVIPCCVDVNRITCDVNGNKELLKKYNLRGDMVFVYPGKLGTFYLFKEMLRFFEYASGIVNDLKFLILTQDDIVELKGRNIYTDSNKVFFIRPSFDEMPNFLRCADAGIFFINPYKKFGSSPIKLGEFLACGRPVIINAGIGDTEELVVNNRVGVVLENFSKEHCVKKFNDLLELLQEKDVLEKRCRQTAEKYLSLDIGASRYADIYSRLANFK